MTDRPIIFSGPMVRALLDDRKKQTRRILRPQPYIDQSGNFCAPDRTGKVWNWGQNIDGTPCLRNFIKSNVRFAPGDRLWVREAWAPLSALTHNDPGPTALINRGFYRADEGTVEGEITRWRPSIHMPRWASRLTLVVTEVRVERLQDISEADAAAEGGTPLHAGWWSHADGQAGVTAKASFGVFWNSINGADAWGANPWVGAVSFTVHRANIDALDIGAAA